MSTQRTTSIRGLIERSSLGTKAARRQRASVPMETGRALVARAAARAVDRRSETRTSRREG
jgi:hypothetical protein